MQKLNYFDAKNVACIVFNQPNVPKIKKLVCSIYNISALEASKNERKYLYTAIQDTAKMLENLRIR